MTQHTTNLMDLYRSQSLFSRLTGTAVTYAELVSAYWQGIRSVTVPHFPTVVQHGDSNLEAEAYALGAAKGRFHRGVIPFRPLRPAPAKIARRKRRGRGKRHCGPFKAADTPPEGEGTTPDPKPSETPHSGDSRPHPDQPPTIDQERQRDLRSFYAMMACMFGLKRHD